MIVPMQAEQDKEWLQTPQDRDAYEKPGDRVPLEFKPDRCSEDDDVSTEEDDLLVPPPPVGPFRHEPSFCRQREPIKADSTVVSPPLLARRSLSVGVTVCCAHCVRSSRRGSWSLPS